MDSRKVVLGIHEGVDGVQMAILDSGFNVLSRADTGSPQSWRKPFTDCLRAAKVEAGTISTIGIATSAEMIETDLARLNHVATELLPNRPVVIEQELITGLIAETGHHFGMVVLCGTDSNIVGLNRTGKWVEIGGWGQHINAGGSYGVARAALSAAAAEFDGTGGATSLSGRILTRLHLGTPQELRTWLHGDQHKAEDFLAIAEDVVALEDTDAIASAIILRVADSLATHAQAGSRRLALGGERFPFAMAGSLFETSALLRSLFTQTVQAFLPGAVTTLLTHDFAVCAAMLALEKQGAALPQIELKPNNPPRRGTERRNALTLNIQERPTLEFVRLMNAEDQRVPRLIESTLEPIARLIDGAAERFERGGRLLFIGAGTSGRLALLDAAECRPTFGTTSDEVEGILAGGDSALIHSVEGAEDDEAQGRAEIARRDVQESDSVIGIAASGTTPFVRGALHEAIQRGALTGCIVNNADSTIASLVQHPIVIPTGPEVIMGSTRLKAGTAQKLALNMISTGVMVRVGKTYGNLMVNMQMSNAKLRGRAAVIVAEATGLPPEEASDLLERCNGEMKTAIACYLLQLSPAEARARLKVYAGNLFECLRASPPPSQDG